MSEPLGYHLGDGKGGITDKAVCLRHYESVRAWHPENDLPIWRATSKVGHVRCAVCDKTIVHHTPTTAGETNHE